MLNYLSHYMISTVCLVLIGTQEQQMLLQKCHLLNAQGKLDEFLSTAKELLFQEWREVEAEHSNALSLFICCL